MRLEDQITELRKEFKETKPKESLLFGKLNQHQRQHEFKETVTEIHLNKTIELEKRVEELEEKVKQLSSV